jgi:hypothetical protein
MTSTTPTAEIQSKPEVDLDDRIAEVRRAVHNLDSATDDLIWALERLDDEEIPASVRELAADMSSAADGVRDDFECGDFSNQVDELEELADKEDEDDEDENEPSLPFVAATE